MIDTGVGLVAPLAGSVDRNSDLVSTCVNVLVAPLAGSVDRNLQVLKAHCLVTRRSPRGERG